MMLGVDAPFVGYWWCDYVSRAPGACGAYDKGFCDDIDGGLG